MNRKQFLDELIKLYPISFSKDNAQMWIDNYKLILDENIDFTELKKIILIEHENMQYAPTPSWLYQKAKILMSQIRHNNFVKSIEDKDV